MACSIGLTRMDRGAPLCATADARCCCTAPVSVPSLSEAGVIRTIIRRPPPYEGSSPSPPSRLAVFDTCWAERG
jgi:hypothetical protein